MELLVCISVLHFRYLVGLYEIIVDEVIPFYYHSTVEEAGEISSEVVFLCMSFCASFWITEYTRTTASEFVNEYSDI